MKNKVRYIGIMVGSQKHRKWVLQSYQKYISNDIGIFSFMPSSIRWKRRRIVGMEYINKKYNIKLFPFPSIVYNRYYGAERSLAQRLEDAIGEKNCFNHINHLDKLDIYGLFKSTELIHYLPQTLPYDAADVDYLLDNYGVIYLKPSMGNKGKGVYRVELTESGDVNISQHHFRPMRIIRDKTTLKNEIKSLISTKKYIVQQGVSNKQVNGQNFDVRVLVQKNNTGSWGITNIITRIAHSGYFNTSMCQTIAPAEELLRLLFPLNVAHDLIEIISRVSLITAQEIELNGGYHLGELSVDFAVDKQGEVWVIEINGNPQRNIYKGLPSYRNVYRNPIYYACYLLSQSNPTQ